MIISAIRDTLTITLKFEDDWEFDDWIAHNPPEEC
jgi:hypothetical protein